MKKALLSLIALAGALTAATTGAYYTDNCTAANNYCGGTVYRCDINCTGTNLDYNYCNSHCAGWNGNYYLNNNYNSCYYDSWGTYRCDSSTNYYSNYYNNRTGSNCRYDGNGYYRCDTTGNYPSWYPLGYWWWSQDDLNLMTQSLNSDIIAKDKQPDFFATKVIRKDNNWKKLNAITIKKFSFRDEGMQEKYDDSKKFLVALKDAVWQRYADGVIKNYQMADIVTNLTDTVYNLNKHFEYSARYEKTKDKTYDELAMERLDDVTTNYDRLKGSLRWR